MIIIRNASGSMAIRRTPSSSFHKSVQVPQALCHRTQGLMIDFWRSAIRQQFHAAIDMLANAIKACPDSVWSAQGQGAFWYLAFHVRSEEHTSELQSHVNLVCRLLLEKKNTATNPGTPLGISARKVMQ